MKRNRTFASILVALCLSALIAGCKTDEAAKSDAAMGAINDTCPVTQQAVDPNAPTVVYNGSTIGFCCPGCIAGWNKMSDEQKKAYVRANAN
jgi:hypothetical protein